MNKRRTREHDDALLMPPPFAPTEATEPALSYPEDSGHTHSRYLAPPSLARQATVTASTSRRPTFGRFSSTGPRGRNALDSIGYVPENIPTPRTTRPFSAVGGTKKRQRGLKLLPTASTSPILPKLSLRSKEPSEHPSTSSKYNDEADDHEYIVDSSDDEEPVPFNLHPKDVPRSPKIARTSKNNPSTRSGHDRTAVRPGASPSSSRVGSGTVASSSRLPVGTTPARRKNITSRLGITPARPLSTSARPLVTPARSSNPGALIDPTPIPLNLGSTIQNPRRVNSPFLPPAVTPSGSRIQSSGSSTHYRERVVPHQPTSTPRHPGPSRLSQSNLTSTGTEPLPLLAEVGAGTKRGPGSKSVSPHTGPKRPRISAPSPSAAEDIIVVSSSDDETDIKGPGEATGSGQKGGDNGAEGECEIEETERERRPPSPSPSLGDYRPTPLASRSRSRSASSDIVLIGSRPDSTSGRDSNEEASQEVRKEAPRQSTREVIPESIVPAPLEEVPRLPPPAKGVPPSTPRSHHSSSSEQLRVSRKRAVRRVESNESSQLAAGETGTGLRTRRGARVPESSPSPPEAEIRLSSRKQGQEASPRPADPPPERTERATLSPKKSSPPVNLGSPSPSPPWTGKPLFRAPTTSVSSLTTSSKDRPPRNPPPQMTVGWSQLGETGPPLPRDAEPLPSHEPPLPSNAEPKETLDDDPLQSMYDEPIYQPPQYRVAGPSHGVPPSPGRSSRRSIAPSYSNFSYISTMPPPTVSSVPPARRPAVRRLRMDCVLLPRASKATRRALERFERKGKGKGKDPSEYPSQQPSVSTSQAGDPSTPGSTSQAPTVKYLVIDPQLALPSYYESLPPEIEESSERYCHCCRTRSMAGTIKMRCGSMTHRRKKGVPQGEAHECGLYWCQRCIAKHDIPFNPLLETFKCPLCTGICECDVCRRERGQEPLGRWAMKTVKVKPGKRSFDAFVKGRIASGSGSRTSNPTATPSESIAEMSDSTVALPEPPEPPEPTSGPLDPDIGDTTSARRVSAPGSLLSSKPALTTWYGWRPPPPLRHRRASEGHTLSTETHIFIPRGPRKSELGVDTSLEQVDESLEYSEGPRPESEKEQLADDDGESIVEDRLQAFEGDYSAAGDASLLGADSGAFELDIDHGPDDSVHDAGETGGLELEVGAVDVVVESGSVDPGVADDSRGSMIERESGPSVAHTPAVTASPTSTEVPIGTLAYPPSDSDGSQADARTPVPPAPEDIISTSAGTLECAPTAGVLDDIPVEASRNSLTVVFNKSIQGLAESDSAILAHDYGSTSLSRQTSETGEFPSTSEADEPRLRTPDLELIQAELVRSSTAEPELNLELNPDLGQLHPEGTFATVPCISRGDGGDYTIYGSLQDISLFNAVTDCSDDTHGIALSSSQSEPDTAVCGSLSEYCTQPEPTPYSPYRLEIERLAIFELEGFESESEHEPELTLATDPESAKSSILETPSPLLESNTYSNLADIPDLFTTPSDEPRASPFTVPTEEKQAQVRNILQSRFAQSVEPETRTTRSQTRRSTIERGKFLRSNRCYGITS
ncbi:unnamed protein product [Rhizoctonia solani]|uniref:Zinc-finger domain-containing protein n=1 Tax=Rhizoctonia solani TaxID=456999 RepID=A0A8H3BSC5_9AGAM|nr:unnamed protein product [Rhizoctonia solani]